KNFNQLKPEIKVGFIILDRALQFSNFEVDEEQKTNKKGKFDLNLSEEIDNSKCNIPPYSIYIEKRIGIEVKEFRKTYFITFIKYNEKNDIKNRFNITLDQLPTFIVGLQKMNEYVKQH
ncbi:hypothetical protein AVEN_17042-1, partial [Araneus ventricosus]